MEELTILVTGGIGSGKSAVTRYLASRGVPIYDSDSRTKALYDIDPDLVPALERKFGCSLRTDEGSFDRKRLASVIFSSPERLVQCEETVHPAVLKDFLRWKSEALKGRWCGYGGDVPFVCMESAIAADKPLFKGMFNATVLVDAPFELRLERACKRDNAAPEAIRARMENQNIGIDKTDYIINNNSSITALQVATDEVFGRILADLERMMQD